MGLLPLHVRSGRADGTDSAILPLAARCGRETSAVRQSVTRAEIVLSKLFRNVLIRTQEKMSPLLMVLSACPRRLFERAGGGRRRLSSHSSRRRRSPRRNGPAPPARIGAPGISELCCPFLWQCLRPAAA